MAEYADLIYGQDREWHDVPKDIDTCTCHGIAVFEHNDTPPPSGEYDPRVADAMNLCAQCGRPMDDSPSLYFCRSLCQEEWAKRYMYLLTATEEWMS